MQPAVITPTLGYLRDRISVPRDMCYPYAYPYPYPYPHPHPKPYP